MKHILIITEDISKIQTLTGILGRLFICFYTSWLKFRLRLLIVLLRPFFRVTVITSDLFQLNADKVYYYGEELAKLNYAVGRHFYRQITARLLREHSDNLFFNRLAIHLTHDYFIYAELYEKLLN